MYQQFYAHIILGDSNKNNR